jgi:hypothetical protein
MFTMIAVVHILFFAKNEAVERQVFGIYSTERAAYKESDRLEATGRYECSVLSTPLLD